MMMRPQGYFPRVCSTHQVPVVKEREATCGLTSDFARDVSRDAGVTSLSATCHPQLQEGGWSNRK